MAIERKNIPELTFDEWLGSTLETCRSATRTVQAIYVTMAEIQKSNNKFLDYLNQRMEM